MSKKNKNFLKNPAFWIITTFLIGLTVGLVIYFATKTGDVGSHFTSRNSELGDDEDKFWTKCYSGGHGVAGYGKGPSRRWDEQTDMYINMDRVCEGDDISDINAQVWGMDLPACIPFWRFNRCDGWETAAVDKCNKVGDGGYKARLWGPNFKCEVGHALGVPTGVWLSSDEVLYPTKCHDSGDCPDSDDNNGDIVHNFCNMEYLPNGNCETCDNFKVELDCYNAEFAAGGINECLDTCFGDDLR